MKILVSPQIFMIQKYGGISRYYTEMLSKLKIYKNIKIEIPVFITENVYFNESKIILKNQKVNAFKANFLSKIGISYRKKIKNRNYLMLINSLKKQNFDLFIPTYYDTYFLEFIDKKPFVLTVYDMIHELFPQYFINDPINVVKNKKFLMEKATIIIAISECTKKDILKIYPHIDSKKIKIVYLSQNIIFDNDLKIDLPKDYILFVGNRENYKNFRFFIIAVEPILKKHTSLKIVCAGGGDFQNDEIEFMSNMNIQNNVIYQNFNENELGNIYKNAKCFIFPSAYEGFGIPVLESMVSGCPVILTNNSSFSEVAGNAGIYFELDNEIDLREKINELLNNENLRIEFINKGYEQVKKFSWQKTADDCLKIYQDIIK